MKNLFLNVLINLLSKEDKVANYKELLNKIDDCLFVEVLDELREYNIDIKKFDELLDKEDRTEAEEILVSFYIEFTNDIIREHIEKKIQELVELLDNF